MSMLKRIFRYKRIWLLLLAPVGLLLTLMARINPAWVERYSTKIYPIFSNSLGWLLSLVPFSVLEILILLLGAASLFYIGWAIAMMIRNKARWKNLLWRFLLNLLGAGSVIYLCFVLFMGLNYYRASITEYLDLSVEESTEEELFALCKRLVQDCNIYRDQVEEEDGIATLSDSGFYETADSARAAYQALSKEIPVLKGAYVRNKPLLTSKLFTMVLTTGIYIPFESGINVDVPAFTIPATMTHELTHFRGFMREDEANFLAYLACLQSERADFKYSGSLLAFGYAFPALYQEDKKMAKEIAMLCDSRVIQDINFESAYWKPYRNTIVSNTSEKVYDQYLQSNGQESGTKSYGEMVDLLLAYYREN